FSKVIGSFNQSWVIQRLHSLLRTVGINSEGFSGHSFRRGAANSALQAGISRQDIMKMGRWKSDAMDRYFSSTTNTKNLLALSKQLHSHPGASISTVSSIDDPTLFPSHSICSHSQRRKNRRLGSHLGRECQVASAASLERWSAWLRAFPKT